MSGRADLDRLLGDRAALVAALENAGAHLDGDKARCPFHDDAKASGAVHEHGGRWYFTCHGCTWNRNKPTGDVVDVVRRARGLDFLGALAVLGVAGNGQGGGENGAPSHAPGSGGTPARGASATGPESGPVASVDVPNVADLASECARRLQADPAALAELWTTRAVDTDTARRFGVGVSADGRYWTFPVDDGGRVVAVKHHRIDPAGGGLKCFWTPKGTPSRRLWPVSLDAAGPVWLCPGELKALAVLGAGRSAVGITSGESADLPDELANVLKGRAVALVADDDAAGRTWAHKALDTLGAAGLDVRPVDVGLCKADGLKDIGDVIRQWAVDDARDPEAVGAALDAAYEQADPWRPFTLGGIWTDKATWAPVYHVPTGLAALDAGLGGGLRVGGVHLFTGKSGRAKTQLVTQLAVNAALAAVPVGIVSLEMSRRDVGHLVAASLADVPRKRLADGSLCGELAKRVKGVLRDFAALPLTVVDDDFWTGALTRSGLVRIVGDGCKRFGWRLVALDYLGLLGNEPNDASDYGADLENSAALKRLARVQDIALVAVAALRKYGRKDDAPTCLDDVLGAGRIVYDAYNVFAVDCEQAPSGDGTKPSGLVRLRPLKTRWAGMPPGQEVLFQWWPGCGRVCDLDAPPMFDRPETRQAERQAPDAECVK